MSGAVRVRRRLAGAHGSRTHPAASGATATVLKTEEPTGTQPLPGGMVAPREARNTRTFGCAGGLLFRGLGAQGGDSGDLCQLRRGQRVGPQVLPRVRDLAGRRVPGVRLAEPARRT